MSHSAQWPVAAAGAAFDGIAEQWPLGRVAVLVVPTDEELMIARHTVALLSEHRAKRADRKRA